MNDEKRMAGEYEIIQSLHIGDKEVVIGENQAAANGEKYMCAFCQRDELFALYDSIMASDDYAEIVELYGQRVTEQAQKTMDELSTPKAEGIENTALTAKDCTPISYDDDINDRIVVIKPEILRREYRVATHQLKLCIGGFGASPHSRGSACFCVDLYSGTHSRYERRDVLGTLKPEQLPEWAKKGLEKYQNERQSKDNGTREVR